MTVSSLLQQAVAHHQQGRYHQAQALYRQVLASAPRQFDALHLLGVALRQCGDIDGAIAMIGQAIAVDPGQASAYCNLGVALADAGRLEEALQRHEAAIALNPGYAMAYCNRGNVLRALGRLGEALNSYDKALLIAPASAEVLCHRAALLHVLGRHEDALTSATRALEAKPRYAPAHCARGNILLALQRIEEAIDSYSIGIGLAPMDAELHCNRGTALQRVRAFDEALRDYDRAIALRADYAQAHYFRGNVLRALAKVDEAASAYRAAQSHGYDAVQLQFALASVGVGDAPASAPDGYVKTLFDRYADHFDRHLLDVLDYKIPRYIAAALQAHGPLSAQDTIDLGCGTGLCGDFLRPMSRRLAGVDLSQAMLDKARLRAQYDVLACADLVQYLHQRVEQCDLVVAADVFVYIGDLAPVFGAVQRILRQHGLFCFSVEAGEGQDFSLQASNRYAHARPYIERLALAHGFEISSMEKNDVRREHHTHLAAHIVVLRKC